MQPETIIGDRTGDLTALSTRRWDAVVDVAAYDPEVVRRSAVATEAFGDRSLIVRAGLSRDADLRWVPSARPPKPRA